MTNKINFNDKQMQDVAVAVMNDVLNSDATGTGMDDAYKTVCKYVNVTREQFEENFAQAKEILADWKNDGLLSEENCELNEEALDMVVGGGVGDFFCSIGRGLATAAGAVGNFVKEEGPTIGLAVALGLAVCAVGTIVCTGGWGVIGLLAQTTSTFAEGATLGAMVGSMGFGGIGAMTTGIYLTANYID